MASSRPLEPGTGYASELFKTPLVELRRREYICTHEECKNVLSNPIQLECGDRVCKKCYDFLLLKPAESRICQGCLKTLQDDQTSTDPLAQLEPSAWINAKKCHPDSAAAREIKRLEVVCPHGCGANKVGYKLLTIVTLEKHLAQCANKPTVCRLCMNSFFGSHHSHLLQDCFASKCPFGCTDMRPGELTITHWDDASKFDVHFKALLDMIKEVEGTQGASQGGGVTPSQMTAILDRLLQLECHSERTDRQLVEHVQQLTPETAVRFVDNTRRAKSNQEQLKKLNRLHEDMKSTHRTFRDRTRQTENEMAEVSESVNRAQILSNSSSAMLGNQKVLLKQLEITSFNGRLIWKIDHVQSKRSEAQSHIRESLFSNPFYTEVYGYKMCAKLYWNGNGSGRNSHISVYFVVMRGEYDNVRLRWPLQGKVTLKLRRQTRGRRDIVKEFRADGGSFSFAQPKNEMNIATGCPQFATQEMVFDPMNDFVVDDTMFIEVIVDISCLDLSGLNVSIEDTTR